MNTAVVMAVHGSHLRREFTYIARQEGTPQTQFLHTFHAKQTEIYTEGAGTMVLKLHQRL